MYNLLKTTLFSKAKREKLHRDICDLVEKEQSKRYNYHNNGQ